ncbi:DUF2325 domain-containing protein [Herbaspirillum sp. YR522]|uniref:DUF2325 domain-containing protein n=1 Tax=Herbaspirillum sp. YR522 TaxID=1144342 RepID=UPI00026F64A7|nr:DUF2325 domain-containing protein [Herbaspirillum sp. YR522]EJN10150.1 hypothetical protein PMI40_00196 [Herbaspirillum sp. YR522]
MTDQPLVLEHAVLLRQLAAAQRRCDDLLQAHAAAMAGMQAELMKARAAVIARDTALAWAEEDHAALLAATPGLAPRAALARKVSELSARVQDLMREKLRPSMDAAGVPTAAVEDAAPGLSALEASIAGADLVICQTGCLSHGAYWRVHDHCRRTGKTCVMAAQPATFRVVRINRDWLGVNENKLTEI